MAPTAIDTQNGSQVPYSNGHKNTNTVKLPLEPNGSLDSYNHIDLTPCIGREFPTANLVEMMNAPNSDELLAELALTSTNSIYKFLLMANVLQSLGAALYGSGNKTISPTTYKRSLSCGLGSFPVDHRRPDCTFTPY